MNEIPLIAEMEAKVLEYRKRGYVLKYSLTAIEDDGDITLYPLTGNSEGTDG
jgi:hypothetical protein